MPEDSAPFGIPERFIGTDRLAGMVKAADDGSADREARNPMRFDRPCGPFPDSPAMPFIASRKVPPPARGGAAVLRSLSAFVSERRDREGAVYAASHLANLRD